MKWIIPLTALPLLAQTPDDKWIEGLITTGSQQSSQITVTISPQPAPFSLQYGISLYSVEACSQTARTVSAAQLRQVAEGFGIAVQDPALNPQQIGRATSKITTALTVSKWLAAGAAVSAASVAAFKSSAPANVGNARTYGIIAAGASATAVGIPLFQSNAGALQAAQSSASSALSAALISDMTALYAIPAGGCMASRMFFGGTVGGGPKSGVLP